MTIMQQWEVEEALERHSQLFDIVEQVAQRHTDLLLQVTQSYFEMLEKVKYQHGVMLKQGELLNQCMERIMQLEGRGIIANFNQRLEQLEADKGTYYAINKQQLPKMLENVVKRVDNLEFWLSTHDYQYFQEEEKEQDIKYDTIAFKKVDDWIEETDGNSSFEEYEMHHPDPSYVEIEDVP